MAMSPIPDDLVSASPTENAKKALGRPEDLTQFKHCSLFGHVINLLVFLLEFLNTRSYTDPLIQSLSPDFTSDYESTISARDRETRVENVKKLIDAHPNYHCEILSSSVTISKIEEPPSGPCSVSLGFLEIQQESVSVLYWDKRVGEWACYRHSGIRDMGGS